MTKTNDFDKRHIEKLLDQVLGNVSFHGETYADKESLQNLELHKIALKHIYEKLSDTAYDTAGRQEFSAAALRRQIEDINKGIANEVNDLIGLFLEYQGREKKYAFYYYNDKLSIADRETKNITEEEALDLFSQHYDEAVQAIVEGHEVEMSICLSDDITSNVYPPLDSRKVMVIDGKLYKKEPLMVDDFVDERVK